MATVASTGLNALLNETGKIYLSVDGTGTSGATGTVQVLKNAGATVRKAYLVGDSTNIEASSAIVNNVTIAWEQVETTPWGGGTFYSYLTDVTSIVKPTIDAAGAGTLDIAVNEGIQSAYEGLALAVVFDDPNQTVDQSVILYFGGLRPTGGTATINFASPINTSSTLGATFGLGIGYSFNSGPVVSQSSQVQVNGQLLTSVAGNFDDGQPENGALFTIGGLGDSPNNPADPTSTDYTTDDELYNLLPFIKNGDTAVTLNTVNPSDNDHIFFAHLTLQGITATDSGNVVKLSVDPSSVSEDGTGKLVYTFTRTGATTSPLTVGYQVGGTATLTTDYVQTGSTSFTATTGTVTFAAGASTATVTFSPVADTVIEPDETIILTLTNGTGYAVGTSTAVTGTILNDDLLPIISIASGIDAAEPATNGSFTLTRTGDPAAELTVNLAVPTGTATTGADYTALATTATFAAGSATATVTVATLDDTIVEPTETISLALAAGTGYTLGTTTAATINLIDNDVAAPQLEEKNDHCLHIKGGGDKSVLKFTKSNHHGKNKNQVCAFVVDDATGKIDGIDPGHKDYLAAAIDRAQVVFSSLSDSQTDSGFDRNSQRHLNFKSGEHVEFMMIADDTLSKVKTDLAANKIPTNILFSIPEANGDSSSPAKFTALPNNGGYQIDWEDGATETTASTPDFNDMVMRVEVLDNPTTPVGIDIQNQSQGSVMDFRSFAGTTLKVDTKCESDAAYNNNIGFYAVEDAQGTLANGLKPGDAGYAEAAIKSALLRCFKTDTKTDVAVEGGKIYAPVVIANGSFEDYLKNNPQNQASGDIHAYFNYIGANTDKVDHFRLLGDNKFGVEDFYGGGDRDYNDIVFQMTMKS